MPGAACSLQYSLGLPGKAWFAWRVQPGVAQGLLQLLNAPERGMCMREQHAK